MTTSLSSIVDNRDGNTLLVALQQMSAGGQEICIATAFFSLDALLLLADALVDCERIRILFGDDANPEQRRRLLEQLRQRSDEDLLKQRDTIPQLSPLKKVEALFAAGRIEARCYTAKKFHAKAYFITRPTNYPKQLGVIGSGNFTRPGLLQNIELNVQLTTEQTAQLGAWFEARWAEAAQDVVTADVLDEIRRQIDLYEPHILYLKALYTWGQHQQEVTAIQDRTDLWNKLDPHQKQGFQRALKIIERQQGVMICDGVGLGKSFIALALMEKYCREGQNVLLLAPKNILDSSWNGYLADYLSRYRSPFGNIHELAMTELGFAPDGDEEVQRLFERADVLVLDESHNFRTTAAARYRNLFKIAAPYREKRKKVILLTATPINTAYRDISSQLALITHEKGVLGGYSIEQIRRSATSLDKAKPQEDLSGQLSLTLQETPSEALNRVLEAVVIQRSRKTIKALAETEGKPVYFPKRRDPQCIEYGIGAQNAAYRDLIALAQRRFRPGVEFLQEMRRELEKAQQRGTNVVPARLLRGAPKGIKLAAFLTEQYRRVPVEGSKTYLDEVHLAGLVFANTLKQLESSPPAFQGILQSLGVGLAARLSHVLGDEAPPLIAPHSEWLQTPLFPQQAREEIAEENPDIAEDGDTLDATGSEVDAWITQAIQSRQLEKKLRGFNKETFDVERWRNDILDDLMFLREIHKATLTARQQPDPKLSAVLPAIAAEVKAGKALVFTQSQRTAEYLEKELSQRLPDYKVARIDSRVEQTRAAILHAFCPGYNKPATTKAPSIPKSLDILISTDVLSEGVNLQEAGAIFSYDIHWNPVRLIQRIGRVDRRLDPAITPQDHEFAIVNVLPPTEINDILNLVEAVENRTLRISRSLGLDVSFFKSSDPADTLKEFNSQYEGDIPDTERALTEYANLTVQPDPETQRRIDAVPPGAFGVWGNAPFDGLFVLFTMEPTARATETDKEKFASILGRPMLVLERADRTTTLDAGEILTLLSQTKPGEPSAVPSDEPQLSARLRKLKESVRHQFSEIGLPGTILPKLVCWMELRKGSG